jgi:tetratricopeptide (TPR) repeat protein
MDAVQFGRWMSQRRRACGWQSQRALVDAARQDPLLLETGISEDFLARLEAGNLSHPYRSAVRRRVLALAWLLCRTPRDVRAYLRAAEMNELSADEADQVHSLMEYLEALQSPTPLLLPLRPTRFVGRTDELDKLLNALSTAEANVCAVTGMPGSGKSALAYEAVHILASDERERLRLFPDGIATFTGRGRHGINGLVSFLSGITTVFHSLAASASSFRPIRTTPGFTDIDLACAIDRVRTALAGKRVLILLDDVEPDFPLRQALEALLVRSQVEGVGGSESTPERRVVLMTGSYIPAPALVSYRLHLMPLKPGDALKLLAELVGRASVEAEQEAAERICAAVGYLPLAIEGVATSVIAKGMPLSLLAAHMSENLFETLLDGESEMRSRVGRVLETLGLQMQRQFALLATTGTRSFGLECATVVHAGSGFIGGNEAGVRKNHNREEQATRASAFTTSSAMTDYGMGEDGGYNGVELPMAQLANTAADMGRFVRHSLLELAPAEAQLYSSKPRYRLHPVLRAYALDRLGQLEPEAVEEAEHHLQAYALAYIEHYQDIIERLESESAFLLAAAEQAWRREEHEKVVRFVAGLLPMAGCVTTYEEGEHLLLCGVHASRATGDRYHLARFLNRLGVLLCSHGELTRAQYVFKESLQVAEEIGRPAQVWHPLCNLAHIAHVQGEYGTARRYAEAFLQRMEQADDPGRIAVALFKRGFYARLQGDLEKACEDLKASMQLFALHQPVLLNERIAELEARTEFARVQGDYALSREYVEAAVALVQEMRDRYSIADLLYDQACYAHEQGMLEEARQLASRVLDIAKQIGASHFQVGGMAILQNL